MEPISMWPNPRDSKKGMASPLLSYPAARPMGFWKGMPHTLVWRRGSWMWYLVLRMWRMGLDEPNMRPA